MLTELERNNIHSLRNIRVLNITSENDYQVVELIIPKHYITEYNNLLKLLDLKISCDCTHIEYEKQLEKCFGREQDD